MDSKEGEQNCDTTMTNEEKVNENGEISNEVSLFRSQLISFSLVLYILKTYK